jgi:hypothetical protein
MVSATRKPATFGPEPWAEIGGRGWSLWDLWFCAIAVLDHDGDLELLADEFVRRLRAPGALSDRHGNEAKLAHMRDLQTRLAGAGLAAAAVAGPDQVADRAVTRRAREKVLNQGLYEGRALTPAMIDTPRRLLVQRARYGSWAGFPCDPGRCFERFRPLVIRKDGVSKGRTFSVVRSLEKRLADLDGPRRRPPDRLALYRAFHTAGLELADRANDSYGNIGQLRSEAWFTYLSIDWRAIGVDPDVYWRDLCELLLWEPFGLDHQHERSWFGSAAPDDVDRIEATLVELSIEHRAVVLDHEADRALEALADLYVATKTRDRYVDAAGRLGSRVWRPVVAMAESQLEAGDKVGAVAVFRAADQPGWHRDHLRDRCRALTGIDLVADGGRAS